MCNWDIGEDLWVCAVASSKGETFFAFLEINHFSLREGTQLLATSRDFNAHMGEATRNCTDCKSDCELTTYSSTVSSSEFRLIRIWFLFEHQGIFFRKCDSRNLNLSPFCNLASPSMALAKWQPAVNSTYGSTTTTYTNEVEGPMRLKYPGQGKAAPEGEPLTAPLLLAGLLPALILLAFIHLALSIQLFPTPSFPTSSFSYSQLSYF